jgi:hypothetical protein
MSAEGLFQVSLRAGRPRRRVTLASTKRRPERDDLRD